eukprot:CAMPEP_0115702646 /NCGR_PEP_ID=MMETSP0272-20121206/68659_1 /TAXON_ID=71861 /ORGANISM="Scrippsiella trochoidea, Strain CCMP3099" /LENGTH=72 /DNA_ID=CAMNT_0003143423 /DNA_START=1 /DNA_END=216 /DNA_ORIENTATION=-
MSVSIVLTATIAALALGTHIGPSFAFGVSLVAYAVMLYGGVLPPVLRCASCFEVVAKIEGDNDAKPQSKNDD